MADEPVGGPPIVLSPATFARHEQAAQWVEQEVRTRAPRKGIQRSPGAAWSAWGLLESGDTITGQAGLTLGEGDVTLLTQDPDDPAQLVATDEVVHVYNGGPPIDSVSYGGDMVVPLAWNNGYWAAAPNCEGGAYA